MTGYLARRLVGAAMLLVAVSFLIFALLKVSPGSSVDALIGSRPRSPELIQSLNTKYHLTDPFLVQYGRWFGGVMSGDLGISIQSGQTVTSMIRTGLPITLEIAGLALTAAVVIGISGGFAAGMRRDGWLDRLVSFFSVLALSTPGFAMGVMLIYVFGVKLGWLPVYGGGSGVANRLLHLILPVAMLAVALVPLLARQTRAAVRDVIDQDYVTFARARGLAQWRLIIPYVLRNSSLPIITVTGLLAIGAMSGTVLAETVFGVPGIGLLLINSIQTKDIPAAQGVALILAVGVVLINLVVDLFVLILDPRVRQPKGA